MGTARSCRKRMPASNTSKKEVPPATEAEPEKTKQPTTKDGFPLVFDPEAEPLLQEVVEAYRFSPPFFIAWSIGYLSESYLLLTLAIMGMPLAKEKLVTYLGGRGAWAKKNELAGDKKKGNKKPAADAYPHWTDHFVVSQGVWIPPVSLIFFSQEGFQSITNWYLTMGGTYLSTCFFQFVLVRYGLIRDPKKQAKANTS